MGGLPCVARGTISRPEISFDRNLERKSASLRSRRKFRLSIESIDRNQQIQDKLFDLEFILENEARLLPRILLSRTRRTPRTQRFHIFNDKVNAITRTLLVKLMERKWSRERIVHGNGTEWLPLGGCSRWFFLRFCREQKVISRAARHAKEQERNGGGKRDSLFTRTMKGVPSRALYARDGGEVTNYSTLYPQAPFLRCSRAFHPGNRAERQTPSLLHHPRRSTGISRPSIHHKAAVTMLTTSFRHVVVGDPSRSKYEIAFVVSARKFMKHLRLVSLFPQRRSFPPENIAGSRFVPACYSLRPLTLSR